MNRTSPGRRGPGLASDTVDTFVTPGSGLRLEYRFVSGPTGGPGAVVAPPHPVYGGELTNPVVEATARGLRDAGTATLAFNFRGTGASEGRATDQPESAADDYLGALDTLAGLTDGPYLAAGYSFGSAAALAVAATTRWVRGVVLVAPPVSMVTAARYAAFAGPLLVVVGDRDTYAPLDELRAELAVRPDAVLAVVEGADHFFAGGASAITPLVAEHVRPWLGRAAETHHP